MRSADGGRRATAKRRETGEDSVKKTPPEEAHATTTATTSNTDDNNDDDNDDSSLITHDTAPQKPNFPTQSKRVGHKEAIVTYGAFRRRGHQRHNIDEANHTSDNNNSN